MLTLANLNELNLVSNTLLRTTKRVSIAFTLHEVVDHYENPRNVGSFDKTSKNVGTGLVGAPACGDVMKLQVRRSSAEVH